MIELVTLPVSSQSWATGSRWTSLRDVPSPSTFRLGRKQGSLWGIQSASRLRNSSAESKWKLQIFFSGRHIFPKPWMTSNTLAHLQCSFTLCALFCSNKKPPKSELLTGCCRISTNQRVVSGAKSCKKRAHHVNRHRKFSQEMVSFSCMPFCLKSSMSLEISERGSVKG